MAAQHAVGGPDNAQMAAKVCTGVTLAALVGTAVR